MVIGFGRAVAGSIDRRSSAKTFGLEWYKHGDPPWLETPGPSWVRIVIKSNAVRPDAAFRFRQIRIVFWD
jgi:hypothetical protein